MPMELCACRPISDLPVFSTVLPRNQQLRPKHAPSLKMPLASRFARGLHFRYRHFSVSLPSAAASDDSYGSSPSITEERDSATVLEDSPPASSVALEDSPPASSVALEDSPSASSVAVEDSPSGSSVAVEDSPAEKLSSDEIVTSEVPKEEPVEDAPVVAVEDSPSASSAIVEDSSSAEKVAYNEISTAGEPKEVSKEPVEVAQEWAFELLNDLKLESVDKYSLYLYGGGAFFGLWLVSAIVGAVDSIPLVPKLLEIVGLGYTVWFAARFLLLKESRDELAAKIDEIKEQVIGSD